MSIFWPANPERDLAGYLVYRADGEPSDRAQWTKLTDQPVTRTTFRDDRARPGTRYSYRLSAVDRYGNESAPSVPVTETASP